MGFGKISFVFTLLSGAATVGRGGETMLRRDSPLPPTVGSGGVDPYNKLRDKAIRKDVNLVVKSEYPWFETKDAALKHCADNHACDDGKCYTKRKLGDLHPCPKSTTMLCEHAAANKFFSYECVKQSPLPWNGDRQWGLHRNHNVHSFSEKT